MKSLEKRVRARKRFPSRPLYIFSSYTVEGMRARIAHKGTTRKEREGERGNVDVPRGRAKTAPPRRALARCTPGGGGEMEGRGRLRGNSRVVVCVCDVFRDVRI